MVHIPCCLFPLQALYLLQAQAGDEDKLQLGDAGSFDYYLGLYILIHKLRPCLMIKGLLSWSGQKSE